MLSTYGEIKSSEIFIPGKPINKKIKKKGITGK